MQEQLTLPIRFCACGCGEPTRIAKFTKTSIGHVKGHPVRYLPGHVNRLSPHAYEERDCGHSSPCWVWLRHRNNDGYGTTRSPAGRSTLAHIVYWERAHGPVPEGLELDHLCRNRSCVRPDHLDAVTHTENLRRGARAILTVEHVRAIRASGEDARELAAYYGVSRCTIYSIRNRQSWKDVI